MSIRTLFCVKGIIFKDIKSSFIHCSLSFFFCSAQVDYCVHVIGALFIFAHTLTPRAADPDPTKFFESGYLYQVPTPLPSGHCFLILYFQIPVLYCYIFLLYSHIFTPSRSGYGSGSEYFMLTNNFA